MIDRHAVMWTRIGGQPFKMADIALTPKENRILYTREYIASGLPGFSLLADPEIVGQSAVVWNATDRRPFHPRLMAMLPPPGQDNFQRRILSELLAKREIAPAPGIETEWEMLLMSARNGIGHLDVFSDDLAATEWYGHLPGQVAKVENGSRSRLWSAVKNEMRQLSNMHENLESISEILGGTPTAGGMISKVLVSIPNSSKEWRGDFATRHNASAGQEMVDVIVKIESPQYAGLMELEALCLDVHRENGFEVPRSWRADVDGLSLLAIERFDRPGHGKQLPFESFMNVLAAGSRNIQSSQDVLWTELGGYVSRLGQLSNLDVRMAQEQLFRRLAYALMTGNGDMHLDNIGLLGSKRSLQLAPVYDPAPMRAWSRHNMRMSIPIEFEEGKQVYEQIALTAKAFGMTAKQGHEILIEAAEATRDYPDRVMSLTAVPEERRAELVKQVQKERGMLARALNAGA